MPLKINLDKSTKIIRASVSNVISNASKFVVELATYVRPDGGVPNLRQRYFTIQPKKWQSPGGDNSSLILVSKEGENAFFNDTTLTSNVQAGLHQFTVLDDDKMNRGTSIYVDDEGAENFEIVELTAESRIKDQVYFANFAYPHNHGTKIRVKSFVANDVANDASELRTPNKNGVLMNLKTFFMGSEQQTERWKISSSNGHHGGGSIREHTTAEIANSIFSTPAQTDFDLIQFNPGKMQKKTGAGTSSTSNSVVSTPDSGSSSFFTTNFVLETATPLTGAFQQGVLILGDPDKKNYQAVKINTKLSDTQFRVNLRKNLPKSPFSVNVAKHFRLNAKAGGYPVGIQTVTLSDEDGFSPAPADISGLSINDYVWVGGVNNGFVNRILDIDYPLSTITIDFKIAQNHGAGAEPVILLEPREVKFRYTKIFLEKAKLPQSAGEALPGEVYIDGDVLKVA